MRHVMPISATRTRLGAFETPRKYLEAVRALSEKMKFELPVPPGPDDDPCVAAAVEILHGDDADNRDR